MGVLTDILAHKLTELDALRARRWSVDHRPRPVNLRRGPGQPLKLLAEIKRRSPSAGALSTHLSVAERARAYEAAGASMVSVLCDARYFDGDYTHLTEVRAACSLPILCKEFIVDEVQLDAARACGADAALLIVRCLSDEALPRLIAAARARSLLPLVEVHTRAESRRALEAGSDVIGVNARDLDTLQMDAEGARATLEGLPPGVVRVHLSGIAAPEHVRALPSGTDAALVGEALMRQDDPTSLLGALCRAAES